MTTNTLTRTAFLLERIAEWEDGWAESAFYDRSHSNCAEAIIVSCKAQQAIVALHPLDHHGACPRCDHSCQTGGDTEPDTGPCDTLRALASIYSDHPAFDSRWSL